MITLDVLLAHSELQAQAHFEQFWTEVKPLAQTGLLPELILKRREEVRAEKEKWRPLIECSLIQRAPLFYQALDSCLKTGSLLPIEEGLGGSYLLLCAQGKIHFIVKPEDEEILSFNNRKKWASPFRTSSMRVRAQIPLYRSSQASAATFAIAQLIGIESITPHTHIAIIRHDSFYDLSDRESSLRFGLPDKEKLCSVQEYLPQTKELYKQLLEWEEEGLSEQEIAGKIDQNDFELANLLIWLAFDNDAHAGNFRTFPKTNGLFGLKKIDNSLTFPENNQDLDNCLSQFPNADYPLSSSTLDLIEKLPLEAIRQELILHRLENAVEPFLQRANTLKTLTQNPHITIKEINTHFCLFLRACSRRLTISSSVVG